MLGLSEETVDRVLRLIFLDAPAASDLPTGVKTPERETTAGSKPAVVRRNAA
jgi:hypothetical protein